MLKLIKISLKMNDYSFRYGEARRQDKVIVLKSKNCAESPVYPGGSSDYALAKISQ